MYMYMCDTAFKRNVIVYADKDCNRGPARKYMYLHVLPGWSSVSVSLINAALE